MRGEPVDAAGRFGGGASTLPLRAPDESDDAVANLAATAVNVDAKYDDA